MPPLCNYKRGKMILNFLTPYKLYFYGAIVVLFLSLLGYNWYLRVEIKSLKADYKLCNDANISNMDVIRKMNSDIKKSETLCEKRLKLKEETLRKIKKITELKGDDESSSNDPVLNLLNKMWVEN